MRVRWLRALSAEYVDVVAVGVSGPPGSPPRAEFVAGVHLGRHSKIQVAVSNGDLTDQPPGPVLWPRPEIRRPRYPSSVLGDPSNVQQGRRSAGHPSVACLLYTSPSPRD